MVCRTMFCYVQTSAPPSAQAPLVAASDLKKELETLHYREHKKVAIQGHITAVRYMKSSQTSRGTEEKEVRDVSTDACEHAVPDTHTRPSAAEQTPAASSTSASPERISANGRKRSNPTRKDTKSSLNRVNAAAKRRHKDSEEGQKQEEEEEERDSASEEARAVECRQQMPNPDSDVMSWESSSWPKQRQEVSEHLVRGGLCRDSVSRRFTFEEKNVLLQQSSLQPARWTAERDADIPPVLCPGYYRVTILGINKQMAVDAAYVPVLSSDEPGAVGLPQDPHGNTMLSCLSSGFLCPLRDTASNCESTLPEPEEVLATAAELEDTHVVCVLDLCHLGGDEMEVLISKVYRVTEVSLD